MDTSGSTEVQTLVLHGATGKNTMRLPAALLLIPTALAAAFHSATASTPTTTTASIAAPPPPLPANVSVVAGGFSWVENICFDSSANGSMYASERLRGQLLAITSSAAAGGNGTGNGTNAYTSTVLLEGMWKLLLGCVVDAARFPGTVFVVGVLLNGSHVLAAVPVQTPTKWEVVAFTAHTGNGIRIHEATGRVYTSTEGTFLPGSGAVYEIDPSVRPWGGAASVLVDRLAPADGLWIDQARALLYVGLLPSSNVWTYNLTARRALGTFGGLKHSGCKLLLCAMDDFTLDPDNTSVVVGAAWTDDSVRSFPTFSPTAGFGQRTLLKGVQRPTSVRWGSGVGGFAASSLFISEGGSLGDKKETKYRILEWEHAREAIRSN